MFAAISIAISLILWAGTADAACKTISFEDTPFTVCKADPTRDDIRLFLNDDEGAPLGTFDNVEAALGNSELTFAMNAGMYHPDRRPVGLYIENGIELAPIVTRAGPGNFGLLPNGVFCLTSDAALVIESRAFDANRPDCTFATQSGPMLVIDGKLHPRFLPDSTSTNIRNGVGVRADGAMVTAISDTRVTFDHFARLFRDVLNTPNALFLDGSVSRLYAPALNRHDLGFPMGPILGVAN
ncbi:MAG: hypothetical protein HKN27_07235 [Silicimonas sp.]|nr:hypothetical protein [Silicimonas sp.]